MPYAVGMLPASRTPSPQLPGGVRARSQPPRRTAQSSPPPPTRPPPGGGWGQPGRLTLLPATADQWKHSSRALPAVSSPSLSAVGVCGHLSYNTSSVTAGEMSSDPNCQTSSMNAFIEVFYVESWNRQRRSGHHTVAFIQA